MDNSRELARLLRKAQDLHLAKTRPPVWFVTGVFEGEEVPQPSDGVDTFKPWVIIHVDGKRPADDKGIPKGKLCPLSGLEY